MEKTDIAVLGGGVIGLSVALKMLNSGREVVLIDPEEPGSGTSYGNAGTIAEYAVLPVGSPEVIKRLPSLLFYKNSPMAIKRSEILSLAPWLMKFLYQSMPKQAEKNAQSIAKILVNARLRWEDLASQINGSSLLNNNGSIYIYKSKSIYDAGLKDINHRKTLGLNAYMLNPSELNKLEPNINLIEGGAAYFPDCAYMSDPGKIMKLLLNTCIEKGCQVIRQTAKNIERTNNGIKVTLDDKSTILSKHLVVSAGAFSKKFAKQAGDNIPLDVERGYHVEYDMNEPLLNRPCCSADGGFYMSPMSGRLRVVGTVELGGVSPKISMHRVNHLENGASNFFPSLGKPSRTWLGFRPSIPDSKPVISASRKGNDIVYAFGHGHIGLTLAPVTAEIVESIITGKKPPIPIHEFSVQRF
ncbi:MAG: FAD-dependent oxidoreductase [Candidatus Thioglobus sp.]|nr:FAD-dependent oxidoreductase [Candidatus Thioglobus sp.]